MTEIKRRSGRFQLLLIAAVFLGPLLVAGWMYYGGGLLAPEGRTNHGLLLEPIVKLDDELPASPVLLLHDASWLLIYANGTACNKACRERLYVQRQSRLMLGKEMDRVRRIFLHGEDPPDTVFLESEHTDLVSMRDDELLALLDARTPEGFPAEGYFLVDPLGNLVMYFAPDIDPYDMVDDIKHLLSLSRIG